MREDKLNKFVALADGQLMPLNDAVDDMIREVIAASYSSKSKELSHRALLCLTNHLSGHWRALYILNQNESGARENELLSDSFAAIIRCMFDAYLQAAYIAEQDTEARSKLYLDFEHVERYVLANKVVKQSDEMSRHIAESPLREEGEPRLKAKYDAVVDNYRDKNGKVQSHWYKGNLGNLAETVGNYDEYLWYLHRYNSAVHAGPLAAVHGHPADNFFLYAAVLISRMADLLAKNDDVRPSDAAQSVIQAFATRSLTDIN